MGVLEIVDNVVHRRDWNLKNRLVLFHVFKLPRVINSQHVFGDVHPVVMEFRLEVFTVLQKE